MLPDKKIIAGSIKTAKTKFNTIAIVVTVRDEINTLIDAFLSDRYAGIGFNNSYIHQLLYKGKKDMHNHKQYHDVDIQVIGVKQNISDMYNPQRSNILNDAVQLYY